MKGMMTCKICARDFPLIAEERYTATDPRMIGVLTNLVDKDRALEYDAFDCPHCGCQNVIQTRKPIYLHDDYNLPDLFNNDDSVHDGCNDCKYINCLSKEEPCKSCKGNYADKYEKEEQR